MTVITVIEIPIDLLLNWVSFGGDRLISCFGVQRLLQPTLKRVEMLYQGVFRDC